MNLSSRERHALGQLQAGVLDAVKVSRPERPPSDDEIAAFLHVDRSLCSHWRTGKRQMSLSQVARLADHYGKAVIDGLVPAPKEETTDNPVIDLTQLIIETTQLLGHLTVGIEGGHSCPRPPPSQQLFHAIRARLNRLEPLFVALKSSAVTTTRT